MDKKYETIMQEVTERQQEAIELQKKKIVRAEEEQTEFTGSLYALREMVEEMTEYQVIYAETFLNNIFFNGNYKPKRPGASYRNEIRNNIMQLYKENDLHFLEVLLYKIIENEKAPCTRQRA